MDSFSKVNEMIQQLQLQIPNSFMTPQNTISIEIYVIIVL